MPEQYVDERTFQKGLYFEKLPEEKIRTVKESLDELKRILKSELSTEYTSGIDNEKIDAIKKKIEALGLADIIEPVEVGGGVRKEGDKKIYTNFGLELRIKESTD